MYKYSPFIIFMVEIGQNIVIESLQDRDVLERLNKEVAAVIEEGIYRPVVVGVIKDFDGRVLFTMSPKAVSDGEMNWNLPQGGVREGEDILSALKRELNEELGLREEDLTIEHSFGYSDYLLPKGREQRKGYKGKRYFWIGVSCSPNARIMPNMSEVQFCTWASEEMLKRAISSIRVEKRVDVRTVLGLSKL